jgi:hypothetical protein
LQSRANFKKPIYIYHDTEALIGCLQQTNQIKKYIER